jgi:hypothetical protein
MPAGGEEGADRLRRGDANAISQRRGSLEIPCQQIDLAWVGRDHQTLLAVGHDQR